MMFAHDPVVKVLAAIVSLVYLGSAAFSFRKVTAHG